MNERDNHMGRPTIKDYAEYFRLSLEAGSCRESEVETWADKMICETDNDLPDWLLNLSTSSESSMAKLLTAVPGEPDTATVWNLVLAGLGRSTRLQRLSREQVVRVLYRWAVDYDSAFPYHDDALHLDDGFGLCKEGLWSESKFVEDFEKWFSSFRFHEKLLPLPTPHLLR